MMIRTIAAFGLLVGPVLAASPAPVSLEHGYEYEATFLRLCAEAFPGRDCQCGMELLQEEVGFQAFAEAVVRDADAFFRDSPLAGMTAGMIAACALRGL